MEISHFLCSSGTENGEENGRVDECQAKPRVFTVLSAMTMWFLQPTSELTTLITFKALSGIQGIQEKKREQCVGYSSGSLVTKINNERMAGAKYKK
jgi:hypothetical protein